MTRTEHLLQIASEECAETSQRISKALRFGLTEIQAGQELTNAERIVYEFNDIVAMMEILYVEGLIHTVIDQEAIDLKKANVEKWLIHSTLNGTVTV